MTAVVVIKDVSFASTEHSVESEYWRFANPIVKRLVLFFIYYQPTKPKARNSFKIGTNIFSML